jgi:hypothetical protein
MVGKVFSERQVVKVQILQLAPFSLRDQNVHIGDHKWLILKTQRKGKKLTLIRILPMGLNDIQLPPSLLAELYHTPLIIEEKINPPLIPGTPGKADLPAQEDTALSYPTLGNNARNIVVIVRDEACPVIADEDLQFLTGVLKACKLGLGDILLLNHRTAPISFNDLKEKYHPQTMLLFGALQEALSLPLRFPEFQVTTHAALQMLSAPPLPVIEKEEALKRQLWGALKKLFRI